MKLKSGIYSITNIINNKIYIGSAFFIYKRWRQHRSSLNLNKHHNSHLQSAWNLYNESNFKFDIIEYCDIFQLREKEELYIKNLDSKNSIKGYNVNDPKSLFIHKTKESTVQKLSKRMMGSKNPLFGKFGIDHPKHNYKLSIESRESLSNNRKKYIGETAGNVKLTNDQVKEIRQKYIPRVYSTTKLGKEYNVSQGTIMQIVNNKIWTHI